MDALPNQNTSYDVQKDAYHTFRYSTLTAPTSSDHHGRDDVAASTFRYRVFSCWYWEMLAMTTAIALLISMFVLLVKFDGRRAPDWGYSVNLNTIFAIISTAFRAAILAVLSQTISQAKWFWINRPRARPLGDFQNFDFASRSLFSAMALMPTVVRASFPVFLAAVLSVLSVAIGSFTQQSIRTVACPLEMAQDARLPFAHFVPRKPASCHTCSVLGLNTDAELVVFSALTFPEEADINRIQPVCPTGNCTFTRGDPIDDGDHGSTAYSSVGLCHRCIDTTPLITHEEPEGVQRRWGLNQSIAKYTLPTGQTIDDIYNLEYGPTVLTIENHENFTWAGDLASPEFRRISRWAFANFTVLSRSRAGCDDERNYCPSPGAAENEVVNGSTNAVAATCILYPCVRTYTASVSNNQLSEELIGSELMLPDATDPENPRTRLERYNSNSNTVFDYAAVHTPCRVDSTVYSSHNISLAPDATPLTLCETADDGSCTFTNVSAPEPCIYRQTAEFGAGMSLWSYDLFEKRRCIVEGTFLCNNESSSQSKWLLRLYNPFDLEEFTDADEGNATFESIDGFFKSFANSISNHYRSTYGTAVFNQSYNVLDRLVYPLDEAVGTAWETGVCTSSQLKWLVPLVVITVATLVLLVWVVFRSWDSRHVLPAWKESLLPLLFHGDLFQPSTSSADPASQMQSGPLHLANAAVGEGEGEGEGGGEGETTEQGTGRLMELREMERLAGQIPVGLRQTGKDQ